MALLAAAGLSVTAAACGGSGHGATRSRAGCAAAQRAAGVVAPVLTAVDAGRKGAADLPEPLASAAAGFRAAAGEASGVQRDDFAQMADDFDAMRSHLRTATSWSDPQLRTDAAAIRTDTDAVTADCS